MYISSEGTGKNNLFQSNELLVIENGFPFRENRLDDAISRFIFRVFVAKQIKLRFDGLFLAPTAFEHPLILPQLLWHRASFYVVFYDKPPQYPNLFRQTKSNYVYSNLNSHRSSQLKYQYYEFIPILNLFSCETSFWYICFMTRPWRIILFIRIAFREIKHLFKPNSTFLVIFQHFLTTLNLTDDANLHGNCLLEHYMKTTKNRGSTTIENGLRDIYFLWKFSIFSRK